MRTEREMMDLILNTAKSDERIRAVVMNGSRENPNAPKDPFQDYDIAYIAKDLSSFTADHGWIDRFGKRIMLQMPETMRNPLGDGRFTYLMLFDDGNRIDLQLIPLEKWKELLADDSESILLLDKDGLLPPFPPASDRDYLIPMPTELEYESCCNNFWWCTQNVAKGIWRDELPYAMFMLHEVVKAELHFMIDWHIGIGNGFRVSAGKQGKYYRRFLEKRCYERYAGIYSDSSHDHMWNALFGACDLFRELALSVGGRLGFAYPAEDDRRMTEYLRKVKRLERCPRFRRPAGRNADPFF